MHLKDFLAPTTKGRFAVCVPWWRSSSGVKIACQEAKFSVETYQKDHTPLITFTSAIDPEVRIALMSHKYDQDVLVMSISKNGTCTSHRSDDHGLWLAFLKLHLQVPSLE